MIKIEIGPNHIHKISHIRPFIWITFIKPYISDIFGEDIPQFTCSRILKNFWQCSETQKYFLYPYNNTSQILTDPNFFNL